MRRFHLPLLSTALMLVLNAPAAWSQASTGSQSPPETPSAPPRSGLTLQQVLHNAAQNNARLRASALEAQAAEAAIQQAGVLPNPSLSVDQEDTRRATRTTSVLLSQPLELGGKRAARVELAQRAHDLAQAELADRRADVRATATQAFFDALIAQERVAVAEESLRIASGGTTAASKRVIAGKVSPTEETRAKVAEANARIEWVQAQAEKDIALQALAAAMGTSQATVPALDGRVDALPGVPDGTRLDARLTAAPALRRAQADVQRSAAAYQLERSKRIPDLTLSLGTKRSEELGRNQALIGVSIPLPVFDRNQGGQLEALRRQEAAQALAEAEAVRLKSEVMQAAAQLKSRRAEVEALKNDVLPGAQSAYEAASRSFELGKFGFLDVLDAQRTWLLARTQYLRALSDAHRAAAELDRRLGGDENATQP